MHKRPIVTGTKMFYEGVGNSAKKKQRQQPVYQDAMQNISPINSRSPTPIQHYKNYKKGTSWFTRQLSDSSINQSVGSLAKKIYDLVKQEFQQNPPQP